MKSKIKFEEAILEVEGIIQRLENGNMPLDESIGAFEKAVGLIKLCHEQLEAAEERVRILTEGDDGTVTDLPFVGEADEA